MSVNQDRDPGGWAPVAPGPKVRPHDLTFIALYPSHIIKPDFMGKGVGLTPRCPLKPLGGRQLKYKWTAIAVLTNSERWRHDEFLGVIYCIYYIIHVYDISLIFNIFGDKWTFRYIFEMSALYVYNWCDRCLSVWRLLLWIFTLMWSKSMSSAFVPINI